MNITVEKKSIEDIRPSNILPQTTFWGRIKNEQGFEPCGFEIKVSKELLSNFNSTLYIHDDLLVLMRYVDNDHYYAYVPYGPKLGPVFENQGLFLEELSEIIKPLLPRGCIFIRYDLDRKPQVSEGRQIFVCH